MHCYCFHYWRRLRLGYFLFVVAVLRFLRFLVVLNSAELESNPLFVELAVPVAVVAAAAAAVVVVVGAGVWLLCDSG